MVSIVLVTYNRAKRLQLSIQDILDQSFRNFELIICDDCSTDETESVCRQYEAQDTRIRYIRHSANKQMPGNLNFGIAQARYEFVAILHDGDRFRRDLIEQWYNAISKHATVGFVFNSIGESDENEGIIKTFQEFPEGVVKKDELLRSIYFRRPHFDSPVYGEAMVRKELIVKYGFLKKEYGFYADVDLWMELLHDHDAYYCRDVLIKCPAKSFQPQLFKADIVKFNVFLFSMHLKHRKKAFVNDSSVMSKELGIFYVHTLFQTCYFLLLVVKNYRFTYLITSGTRLMKYPWLLFPWASFVVAYPIFKLTLMTYQWTKPLSIKNRLSPSKWIYAVHEEFQSLVHGLEALGGVMMATIPGLL